MTLPRSYQVPAGTCYCVGGAVRDYLLNRSVGDKDYVVVGSSPEQMMAAGFKPVGGDFPVFLHPHSKEEYALARTERKNGRGYHGFVFYSAPTVTLEQDLQRRDLTINAMAMDAAGHVIDYYGGQKDLAAKVLRHVSAAFVEDPVRILRVARFAAMLPEFTIAEETMALMRQMVESGEADALQKERVWRELARGLTASRPSKMIQALNDCGLLQHVLPEITALQGVAERLDYHPEGESYIHTLMVVDAAAARGGDAAECFAALLHDTGKAQTPAHILPSHHGHEQRSARLVQAICRRLRPPRKVENLARAAAAEHGNIHNALEMRAATVVDLLTRVDAYRRPEHFASVLRVCEADFYYLPERADEPYRQGEFLRRALAATQALDQGAIAQAVKQKGSEPLNTKIAEAIRRARIEAVEALGAEQ